MAEMTRENASKVEIKGGLDEAITYLQDMQQKGQNVYIELGGHKLYSCDITVDGAYMEVLGTTKAENDAMEQKFNQAKTKEEEETVIEEWQEVIDKHQKGDETKEEKQEDKKEEATKEDKQEDKKEETTKEDIELELKNIQEELDSIYKSIDYNTTDFEGVGDVYTPQGPTTEQQARISELLKRKQEIERMKIQKEILDIDTELNSIYASIDYNTTDFEGVGDVYTPQGPTTEQQARINELLERKKELQGKINEYTNGGDSQRKGEDKKTPTGDKENKETSTGDKENKETSTGDKENKETPTGDKENKETSTGDKENKETSTGDKEDKETPTGDKKKTNRLKRFMKRVKEFLTDKVGKPIKRFFNKVLGISDGKKEGLLEESQKYSVEEMIEFYRAESNEKEFDPGRFYAQLSRSGYSEEELEAIKNGIKEPTAAEQYRRNQKVQLSPTEEVGKEAGTDQSKVNGKDEPKAPTEENLNNDGR
ncbi:MAG: hypothetical protein ACLUF5_07180 [Clostridia bacterium]